MGSTTITIPKGSVGSPNKQTTGTIAAMPLYAGESVGSVTQVQAAGDVVRELADGAERLLRAWQ